MSEINACEPAQEGKILFLTNPQKCPKGPRARLVCALLSCLVLLGGIASPSFAQSRSEWVERFNSYQLEYRDLFEKCIPSRKSVRMFVDMANCIWRKEQILLKRYKLESILYDVSYDRYSEMFNMGKTAAAELDSGGWEYFSEASVNLEADTEELQIELMKEFLASQ